MTAVATQIHSDLVSENIDPISKSYYQEIDKRMRAEMPHKFKSEKSNLNTEQIQSNVEPKIHKQSPTFQMNNERRIAVPNFVSGDLQKLDEKVKSMMENSENFVQNGTKRQRAKICKLCGKEDRNINIRDHIEANHLEGVSLPCNICAKTFRTRMMLRQHKCVEWMPAVKMLTLVDSSEAVIKVFRTRHAHNYLKHRN